MSLNNIELAPIVLQELFQHTLVGFKKEEKPIVKPATKEFQHWEITAIIF